MEENSFWLDVILLAYQSRKFKESGENLGEAYLFRRGVREKVLGDINPETMADRFRSFFSDPSESVYTAITLEPLEESPLQLMVAKCLSSAYACFWPSSKRQAVTGAALLAGAAALGAGLVYVSSMMRTKR